MHEETFSLEADLSLLQYDAQDVKTSFSNWESLPTPCKVMGRKINSAAMLTNNPDNLCKYPLPVQITASRQRRAIKRQLQDISNRPRSQNSKPRFKSKTPEPSKLTVVRVADTKKPVQPRPSRKPTQPSLPQKSAAKKVKISIEIPLSIKENSIAKKNIDSIVLQTLKKQHIEKKKAQKSKIEEKERQSVIKKQLADLNKNTRVENFNRFKQEKFHPKCAWGTDERRITRVNDVKILKEADELRKKRREERERSKSAGKARIGLDVLKVKKDHSRVQEEESFQKKPPKERDKSILVYMKKQKKIRQRSKEIQMEKAKEDEQKRLMQLMELEKLTRKQQKRHKSQKFPRKKQSKKEEGSDDSHVNYSEDEEVMEILQGVRSVTPESYEIDPQINSFDYKQSGRECMVFGVFPESLSMENKGNITQIVNDIVEKRVKNEEALPLASATMPLADVKASYSVVNTEEEYREGSSSDISKRKEEIRKKLAELRNRVDRARDHKSEDFDNARTQAAVKIQAAIRGFLTRQALNRYFEDLAQQSLVDSEEFEWGYDDKKSSDSSPQRLARHKSLSSFGSQQSSERTLLSSEPPKSRQPESFNYEILHKKQHEIERILETQSEWREIQKQKLVMLKNKDLEDMRAIAKRVGSEEVLMRHFEEIIERRYDHINQLFDENIEAVKSAVEQAIVEDNAESLLHTLERQENFASELFQNLESNEEMNELMKLKHKFDFKNIWDYSENEELSVRISELELESNSYRTVKNSGSTSSELVLDSFRFRQPAQALEPALSSVEPVPAVFESDVLRILQDLTEHEAYTEALSESWDILLTSTSFINEVAETIMNLLMTQESVFFSSINIKELLLGQHQKSVQSVPALELTGLQPIGISMDEAYIHSYVIKLFEHLKIMKFNLEATLNCSYAGDALEMLGKMQEAEIGVVIEKIPTGIRVLPLNLYIDLEKEDKKSTQIQEAQHIHNKMIFDVINELLFNKSRKPEPMIWSFDVRSVSQKHADVSLIITEVIKEVADLNKIRSGKVPKIEFISNSEDTEEDLIQQLREEQLSCMLASEIIAQEPSWIDYEFEETQVKLDVADMTLEELVEETIHILDALKN